MWTDEATLRDRFADIEALAGQCKFHDCKHGTDAGCAIRAALAAGQLDVRRFESFQKLEEEIEKLQASRKKRQMTGDRHARRAQQSKSRKYADRRDRDGDYEALRR
jgi:ribosome biogenesis GTPase